MITEPGNMVIYVAGYPAIMGLQPFYFRDSELARRARIPAESAQTKDAGEYRRLRSPSSSSMKTPERTTAEVFPRYLGGEVWNKVRISGWRKDRGLLKTTTSPSK